MRCISDDLIEAANQTFDVLKRQGLRVVTAESCTAGLVAACLSQSEGASDYLEGSFVTYTKEQKSHALGVPEGLLAERGAVNADVALRMATGALERSRADIALSITGVLGPSLDEDGNPVGLVYLCCARKESAPLIERHAYGDRPHDDLRNRVVCDALRFLKQCALAAG
jgi:nicotinamide-nucleotide amidase